MFDNLPVHSFTQQYWAQLEKIRQQNLQQWHHLREKLEDDLEYGVCVACIHL